MAHLLYEVTDCDFAYMTFANAFGKKLAIPIFLFQGDFCSFLLDPPIFNNWRSKVKYCTVTPIKTIWYGVNQCKGAHSSSHIWLPYSTCPPSFPRSALQSHTGHCIVISLITQGAVHKIVSILIIKYEVKVNHHTLTTASRYGFTSRLSRLHTTIICRRQSISYVPMSSNSYILPNSRLHTIEHNGFWFHPIWSRSKHCSMLSFSQHVHCRIPNYQTIWRP